MSFDIVFGSCRSSGTKEVTNPITGKPLVVPAIGPLTLKEKKATEKVLADYGYEEGLVQLPGGLRLELSLDDDLTGGMIFLREATPEIFSFLFRFADAGSYVLSPIMEHNPAIVTRSKTSQLATESGLFEPDLNIHLAKDANSIAEIIYPAFGDWDAYRAKAINASED